MNKLKDNEEQKLMANYTDPIFNLLVHDPAHDIYLVKRFII